MTAPALEQFDLFGPRRAPMLRDGPPALASVPTAGVITPRDYQVAADLAIDAALLTHDSTLAVLPTGSGKTVLFALQARKRGTVLVIAHEKSLIDQAAQKLRHITGQFVATEKAERRAPAGSKFIVASMQTLRGDRLREFAERFPGLSFGVVDEAHRAVAKSYRDIMAAWPAAKWLLVTATADRGDKKALGLVARSVAYRYDIADACRDGWLVYGDEWQFDIGGVRLDDVGMSTIGGEKDLNQGDLDVQVALQAGQIAQQVIQHCKGQRTLVFTPGVQTAIVGAEALNRLEPGSARAIHGDMLEKEKDQIKAAHARGDFPYLLNCQILIEGYDDPRLANVVMLSKTKSRARFAQIYGRGMRPWPLTVDDLPDAAARIAAIAASPKPHWRFWDANYGKHGHTLASAVDLLGGRYDDDVKARAKKILGAKGGGDVAGALEEAAAAVEAERKKKLARVAAMAAKAKGKVLVGPARSACELFGVSTDMGVEEEPNGEPGASVVSWLVEKGVKNAATMPLSAARGLQAKLKERQKLGFATYKMVRMLNKAGVPNAAALTFDKARPLCAVVSDHYDRGDWNFKFPPERTVPREPGSDDE